MNALKHAEAASIWISLAESDDGVVLTVKDDGKGFDVAQPQPEGHFGSVMMKERALVTGGTYARTSEMGGGTIVRATFPRVWVEEGAVLEASTPDERAAASTPPRGATVGPVATPAEVAARSRSAETAPAADVVVASKKAREDPAPEPSVASGGR